ncbi:MAG: hypothetical protein NZZ41_04225 [Candidatus Dojkabacteria bacterium]|nr:hypothetical protein [Candidatus Dojkabacteria bacterium]
MSQNLEEKTVENFFIDVEKLSTNPLIVSLRNASSKRELWFFIDFIIQELFSEKREEMLNAIEEVNRRRNFYESYNSTATSKDLSMSELGVIPYSFYLVIKAAFPTDFIPVYRKIDDFWKDFFKKYPIFAIKN